MNTKLFAKLFFFVAGLIGAILALTTTLTQKWSGDVASLPISEYNALKKLITTPNTRLSSVQIISEDGRGASGTLVQSGTTNLIITAAHFFRTTKPDGRYSYILDGKFYPIAQVFSHPEPGIYGGKDIAFCVPGKHAKVKNFWRDATDMTFTNFMFEKCIPIQLTLLKNGARVTAIGGLSEKGAPERIYIVDNVTKDGDSGGGIIAQGIFLVVKGNIPSSSFDLEGFYGVKPENITLATKL